MWPWIGLAAAAVFTAAYGFSAGFRGIVNSFLKLIWSGIKVLALKWGVQAGLLLIGFLSLLFVIPVII